MTTEQRVTVSYEQAAAWQAGRLDCHCQDCDATSAASSRCFICGSARLDYRTHAEQHDTDGSYWCGNRKPSAERRAAFASRRVHLTTAGRPEASAAVSGAIPATLGL